MKSKPIPVRVGRRVVGHVWRTGRSGFTHGCEHKSGMSWECGSKKEAAQTVKNYEAQG